MGVWGTALFSDDVACDLRDHYRELLEAGVDDGSAAQRTVEKFRAYLDEPDGIALLAFAVTQSKLGRLDPDVRDRALTVIDRGADLDPSFGQGGIAITPTAPGTADDEIYAMKLVEGAHLVASGECDQTATGRDVCVMKYDLEGGGKDN